jgi:hypothetical protein
MATLAALAAGPQGVTGPNQLGYQQNPIQVANGQIYVNGSLLGAAGSSLLAGANSPTSSSGPAYPSTPGGTGISSQYIEPSTNNPYAQMPTYKAAPAANTPSGVSAPTITGPQVISPSGNVGTTVSPGSTQLPAGVQGQTYNPAVSPPANADNTVASINKASETTTTNKPPPPAPPAPNYYAAYEQAYNSAMAGLSQQYNQAQANINALGQTNSAQVAGLGGANGQLATIANQGNATASTAIASGAGVGGKGVAGKTAGAGMVGAANAANKSALAQNAVTEQQQVPVLQRAVQAQTQGEQANLGAQYMSAQENLQQANMAASSAQGAASQQIAANAAAAATLFKNTQTLQAQGYGEAPNQSLPWMTNSAVNSMLGSNTYARAFTLMTHNPNASGSELIQHILPQPGGLQVLQYIKVMNPSINFGGKITLPTVQAPSSTVSTTTTG